jgi:cobyrinic acid a,c-diamide synthase
MSARGLIVSAPRSGAGKTTVTLALLAALHRRGIAVRAAKSGPDYIDPAFHAVATGRPGCNLDSWAMPPDLLDALASDAAHGGDLLVIEGAMGLFDGVAGERGQCGTAADLAARFSLPVLLVLDVSGQAQSAAAVLRGFMAHDAAVRIGGVILNRVGSERHRALIADAIAPLGVPIVGAIPRDEALALPERHLGLVQASEHADLPARLAHLADVAERCLDLDAVMSIAADLMVNERKACVALAPPGQRIALAWDAAFTFAYPHVRDGWRANGAEIITFSPLADEAPAPDCDVCWLPGGYPELHADILANANRFRRGLASFAATHAVHGECGGYTVLGAGLETADGTRHAMAGLLGHATSFAKRQLHLGYRTARLLSDCAIGSTGRWVRGHEFHYGALIDGDADEPLAELTDGQGRALGKSGGRRGQVTGTFFHAIAQGQPR